MEVEAPPKKEGVIVQEEEQGIKDLLKDAGLLQFEKSEIEINGASGGSGTNGLKFSSRSSFKSYS